MATVRGIGKWASVHQPNTRFEPQYCIDVEINEADAARLEAEGLTVKTDKETGARVVKFKRKAFRDDGSPNRKPNVVDKYKDPFDENIGNGSEVIVQYRPYDWSFGGKKGKSADLVGVQVIKHVSFTEDEFDVLTEEEGAEQTPVETSVSIDDDSPFDK